MNWNESNSLKGPASKARDWWQAETDSAIAVETAAPTTDAAPDGIRLDLVERVRREIAAGAYETEDKLEIAIARMFHDLDQA